MLVNKGVVFSQSFNKYHQSKTSCFGIEKAVFSESLDGLLLTKTTCFTFKGSILSVSQPGICAVDERLLHHEGTFYPLKSETFNIIHLTWIIHTALRSTAKQKKTKENKKKQL